MNKKVVVAIVTYNRKEYLKKLLENIKEQTEKISGIFIFDNNSSDNTEKMLEELKIINEIKEDKIIENEINNIKYYYYRNSINAGGAGGFHKMFELIKKLNMFDYIWTMDDDVLPEKDCLQLLLSHQNENTMITVPNRSDDKFNDKACIKMNLSNPFKIFMKKKTTIQGDELNQKEVIDIVDMAFEGPLINSKLLEKIGLPDEKYFIQFDDTDYATRALGVTQIKFIVKAILHKQIIPKKSKDTLMNWKSYYSYRNDILFCRKYGKNIFVKYLTPVVLYINLMIKAILKRKWKNIKVINKAFVDGYTQKSGKTVIPGEL